MSMRQMTKCLLLAAAGALTQHAAAADQVLEFKLVTMPVEVRSLEASAVEGQSVVLMKMNGVAFFKDGRVASKQFVFNGDFNKGSGPFIGYSTYQFEDGSTINARFAGTLRAGQPIHGEYTIVSGTGVYAGAKGTGMFDGLPHKMTGANLLNGKLVVVMP
jgi:hypothetical protein